MTTETQRAALAEPLFLVCAGGDGYQQSIVPLSGLDDAYLLTQWGSLEDIDLEQRTNALEHFHDPDEWLYIDPLRGGMDRVAVEFSIGFEDGWVRVVRLPDAARAALTDSATSSGGVSHSGLRLLFKAAPGPGDECVFIEAEDASGQSVRAGDWVARDDGLWELRLYAPTAPVAPKVEPAPQEKVKRNDPTSALAIRLLVAAGHVTQEKADEAFTIACNVTEVEARKLDAESPRVLATQAAPAEAQAEPVARTDVKALIDAEMAAYDEGEYMDHSVVKYRLRAFAAAIKAQKQPQIPQSQTPNNQIEP
jgi:hypothetical protein